MLENTIHFKTASASDAANKINYATAPSNRISRIIGIQQYFHNTFLVSIPRNTSSTTISLICSRSTFNITLESGQRANAGV